MSLIHEYFAGALELGILLNDARDKVQWAAKPFLPDEQEKAKICRACSNLRMVTYDLVKAAWYSEIGPYQWVAIHNAWVDMRRRQAEAATPEQIQQAPWLVVVHDQPVPVLTRAQWKLALDMPRRKIARR